MLDAGLIGLPNAGKTSLLNALTGAMGKIGAYAFTTLDPNLGAYYGYIFADIPGLIEGAADGKGLGFKFLRHIARTKMLVHCISLESRDPFVEYKTVRKEIEKFEGGVLAKKPEVIVLTKSDMREPAEVAETLAHIREQGIAVYTVSILDDESVKALGEDLIKDLRAL